MKVWYRPEPCRGIPSPVAVAATHPAIFSKDGSGQGQGLIYQASNNSATVLADSSNPVAPGGQIAIYCTGLGALDPQGVLVNPVSVSIGGQPASVISAGAAVQENLPPDGPPAVLQGLTSLSSFVGLYRIDVMVPGGIPDGDAAVNIITADQTSQAGLTLRVLNPPN